METLEVTFRVITPLFMGGAEPDSKAEIRAPSIKGVMRFWYRAVDPDYNSPADPGKIGSPTWEEKVFGGSAVGQGAFLLKMISEAKAVKSFKKKDFDNFREGEGRNSKNGFIYLGYPLETGSVENKNYQQRKYIDTNEDIKFLLLFKKSPDSRTKRIIISSLWLMGHVGGLGFRGRRCFGTTALYESILRSNGQEPGCEELNILKPCHVASNPAEWLKLFNEGISIIKGWFGSGKKIENDHLVINENARFYLIAKNFVDSTGSSGWAQAMNYAGRLMQDFRSRRAPDYKNVKNHFAMKEKTAHERKGTILDLSGLDVTPEWLKQAPERCQFGLPLTFQYGSLKNFKNKNSTFQGKDHDRNASRIFIRIIKIKHSYYPFFAIFDAPLLAPGDMVKEQSDKEGKNAKPLKATGIIDDFCTELQKQAVALT